MVIRAEWGQGACLPDGYWISFWGDGDVLEFDRGGGCTTLGMY